MPTPALLIAFLNAPIQSQVLLLLLLDRLIALAVLLIAWKVLPLPPR